MNVDEDREAFIALAHAVEPGDARVGAWVGAVGAVRAAECIRAGSQAASVRAPRGIELDGLHARWSRAPRQPRALAERIGARIIVRGDAEWPGQLADLAEREPYALWVLGAGSLRLLALRSVAMVGARAATAYGETIARTWSGQLTSEGWVVVSGCAFGIDAAAHRGALDAGGVTIAVLASGVDVPYPRAHDALLGRIADCGLVVSEVPLGEQVRRQRFLARNRLIAAMSRATVVVEAAVRSGTTATAHAAGDLGRPVLAVPGPVTSASSAGCHRMIRDREADVAASWLDVHEALGGESLTAAVESSRRARDSLDDRELRVLDALPRRGGLSVAELQVRTGMGALAILAALGLLEAASWVERTGQDWRAVARVEPA